jgi:hypothetical protein
VARRAVLLAAMGRLTAHHIPLIDKSRFAEKSGHHFCDFLKYFFHAAAAGVTLDGGVVASRYQVTG